MQYEYFGRYPAKEQVKYGPQITDIFRPEEFDHYSNGYRAYNANITAEYYGNGAHWSMTVCGFDCKHFKMYLKKFTGRPLTVANDAMMYIEYIKEEMKK